MSITTIIGPMFSGKTTELIRLIDRKKITGKKCLIIKNINDIRYDFLMESKIKKHITTHNKYSYNCCDIIYLSELNREKMQNIIDDEYKIVGIDEGFFFKNIKNFCNDLANQGIEIIVATLDSSYEQKMFQEIGDLIAISENVIKLTAVCMFCKKNDAAFTIRIVNSVQEILVGGEETYKSVCRYCMNEYYKCH